MRLGDLQPRSGYVLACIITSVLGVKGGGGPSDRVVHVSEPSA